MAEQKTPQNRPLSPHLQIYRPEVNMVMSILHRITGAALYAGTLLLAWWLVAAASGPAYFEFVNGLAASPIGRLVLLGYTFALMHHLLGGVRHLIWDTGVGFELQTIDRMSWMTLALSTAATLAIWIVGYWMRGAS